MSDTVQIVLIISIAVLLGLIVVIIFLYKYLKSIRVKVNKDEVNVDIKNTPPSGINVQGNKQTGSRNVIETPTSDNVNVASNQQKGKDNRLGLK